MRFTTYLQANQPRLAVVTGDVAIDLADAVPGTPSDLRAALAAGTDLQAAGRRAIESAAPRLPLAGLALAPLVPEPGKIICLGLNYFDHAKEGGREKPVYPWFFWRGASSLLAPGANALKPRVSEKLDWEAELAVVIGKTTKHTTIEQALDAVFG